MTVQSLDRHIVATPDIAGGKPRLAGHRITVQDVAVWHLQLGKSVDEICVDHNLGQADVHAALAYYFDHRQDIDHSLAERDANASKLRAATPSRILSRLKEATNG